MMVAFLNSHGARKEQNYGELTKQMRDEHISVFAVVKTRLREDEGPPTPSPGEPYMGATGCTQNVMLVAWQQHTPHVGSTCGCWDTLQGNPSPLQSHIGDQAHHMNATWRWVAA